MIRLPRAGLKRIVNAERILSLLFQFVPHAAEQLIVAFFTLQIVLVTVVRQRAQADQCGIQVASGPLHQGCIERGEIILIRRHVPD